MRKTDKNLGAELSLAARFSLLPQQMADADERVARAQRVYGIFADEHRQLTQHAKRAEKSLGKPKNKSRRASKAVLQHRKGVTDDIQFVKSALSRAKSAQRKIAKKKNLLRREILEKADVPEQYWDRAKIWVDHQMAINVIYGYDERNHGHVAIDDDGVIYYHRNIGDPHGSQNYIGK